MQIAIIGAGSVGGALGRVWAARGHQIRFGVPNPDADRVRAAVAAAPGSEALTVPEAVAAGDVVVLATPWPATEDAVRAAGDRTGKVVIDATNPLRADFSDLEEGYAASGAERVAGWAPGAEVFKAFNQTGAENMADAGRFLGARPVMFVAGDDPAGKRKILMLIDDAGFEAVDADPLVSARLLEPLAMLWIRLADGQGLGRDIAFGLLRANEAGQ